MKTIKVISGLMILSSILLNNVSADPENQKESAGVFKVNKGGKLYVNVNPGDVKIHTWDKNEVIVKVRGLEDDDEGSLEMRSENNTVIVKYKPHWGWGSEGEFSITIPVHFNVDINTSGGDILVNGDIHGDANFNSMGGDIKMKNIKGKTKVNSQGGDISVGDIDGGLSISTMGGNIQVGNVNGEYSKVSTMGGDIDIGKVSSGLSAVTYGGNVNVSSIGGNADVKTMGGDIDLGNVSGSVKMETNGGNLAVKGASGKVKAMTHGGEIDLRGITGSVEATTTAGNIYVELDPSSNSYSKLYSNNGGITIGLKSSAKATIEAEIGVRGYWKSMRDEYKIYSEFDAKSYKTDEYSKSIKATYVINGGGGVINARSVNENITIKKVK